MKIPAYRQHKPSGQAVVTLSDCCTKQRRDVYLGHFNTPESRKQYHSVLADWEKAGRRLPERAPGVRRKREPGDMSVKALVGHFWMHAQRRYQKPTTLGDIRVALRRLVGRFGAIPAADFGPLLFQKYRSELIADGLARSTVTKRCAVVVRVFRYGVANQYIQPTTLHALEAVEGLRAGEGGVKEGKKIKPVAASHVEDTMPHVPRVVADMARVQLLSAMRSTEVCVMRPVDLDTTGRVWEYRPASHKTAHHGHERVIYLGPKAQAIIKPYLTDRPLHSFLFDPREAEGKAGASASRQRYTRDTYRQAIVRGCDAAYPPPPHLARQRIPATGRKRTRLEPVADWKTRLGPKQWVELMQWRRDHRWHPHQLRHAAGTELRREFGIDAARVILGHRSANVTETYAMIDRGTAIAAALKVG